MKIYYNNFKYSDSIVKSIYIYKSVVFKKLRNVIVFSKISNKSDFPNYLRFKVHKLFR